MSLDTSNNSFKNKELNNFDVMQHIRNIYDILGVVDKKDVGYHESTNVVERLDSITKNPLIKGEYDTMDDYLADLNRGKISPNDIYQINDDRDPDYKQSLQWKYYGETGTTYSPYKLPAGYNEVECVISNADIEGWSTIIRFSRESIKNMESENKVINYSWLLGNASYAIDLTFNADATELTSIVDSSDDPTSSKLKLEICWR